MGRVRLSRNGLPRVIANLHRELDQGVDRAGDELALDVAAVVRVNTGLTARTSKNYDPGMLHATVGVGVRGGAAFYVRFWEFGWSGTNSYGVGPQPGEHRVMGAGLAFMPAFQRHLADAVLRAL